MFDNHFEIFLADTQKSKAINYSIRYQVYCEEMGFEDKEHFPSEQETDEYDDDDTVYFIVRHKTTKAWVGAMRLIPKKHKALPLEINAKLHSFVTQIKPGKAVELSRLCVIKEMRRAIRDIDSYSNTISEDTISLLQNKHNISRKIIWGLLHAAAFYCYHKNISNWYFLTCNALAKILRKGGLNLTEVGGACFHKGERFPYRMDVKETYYSKAWHNDYHKNYQTFSSLESQTFGKKAA